MYYLSVTNASGTARAFSLQLNGAGETNAEPEAIGAPFVGAGGTLGFTVTATVNASYRVQVSSTLTTGSWQDYTNYVQTAPAQLITVPIDPHYPVRFFRIVWP